jgi:hypothetical protein
MAKRFIVSDENVLNTYGFRVMSAGLSFPAHVPAFEEHDTSRDPIGHWVDFQLKDGQWTAEFVPNLKSQRGKDIAEMVEDGHLGQASIGIDLRTVKLDKSPEAKLKDQKLPTFQTCVAPEISIVKFASNRNAVALFDGEHQKMVNLSSNDPSVLAVLERVFTDKNNSIKSMKKIIDFLKLADNASEDDVLLVAQKLSQENGELKAQNKTLSDQAHAQREAEIKTLLDDAEKVGKINATTRPSFLKLFAADYDAAKATLEGMEGKTKLNLADYANGGSAGGEKPKFEGKSWNELAQHDPATLAKLKAENYELFKLMYQADNACEWKD